MEYGTFVQNMKWHLASEPNEAPRSKLRGIQVKANKGIDNEQT
jgi:hypothetical protein